VWGCFVIATLRSRANPRLLRHIAVAQDGSAAALIPEHGYWFAILDESWVALGF
jgi:hypothetical protein